MVGLNISSLIKKLFFFLQSKQQSRKGNVCMSRNRPTLSRSATEHALKQEVKVAWKQLKKTQTIHVFQYLFLLTKRQVFLYSTGFQPFGTRTGLIPV